MLSRVFGSTADEANALKLEFRSSLPRLAESPIPTHDSRFWRQFFQVFDAPSEIVQLLPADLLRAALNKQPTNIATLFQLCVTRLADLIHSPTFPTQNALSNGPAGWFSSVAGTSTSIQSTREFLNAARVLSRLLPVMFEKLQTAPTQVNFAEDQASRNSAADWMLGIIWNPRQETVSAEEEANADQASQFVIDDEDEENQGEQQPQPTTREVPALGDTLLRVVLDSLFIPGFTLPPSTNPKPQLSIWEVGIGQSTVPSPQPSKTHLSARAEMLRLLLAMLSSPVFAPNSSNVFQERLSALKNRKMALTLLCSLLNTALENKGNPLLHSVSSPSNVYSKLSELALQPKTEDLADLLPSLCCQLIDIVLLPTPPPSSPSAPPAEVNSRPMSPEVQPAGEAEPPPQDDPKPPASTENVFRMYVGKLHRPADLEFVWRNLFQALQHTPAGYSNPIAMIPGLAQTRLDVAECLVLLWRFMDCNKAFLEYILTDDRPAQLMVLLLNICIDLKDEPAHFNVIRLCAFVLQSLSAEKSFGTSLNTPIAKVPNGAKHGVVANGSAADFLITSVATMIFSTPGSFNVVYPSFILSISNCSAHFKRLSVLSSTKLLQLFLAFSAPAFILAEEGNPRLVYYLVEAFNYIIYYQLANNPNLIYGLIQSHRRFETLSTFTVKGAVEEIRRTRSERRSISPSSPTPESAPGELKTIPSTINLVSIGTFPAEDKSFDEEDPVRISEKARGKMRERSMSTTEGSDNDPGFPGPYRSQSGFVPTEGWVASWREHLPLDSILIMLSELRPKVESLCSTPSRSTTQAAMDFLQSVTLTDQLPPPPPLKPRRFQQSAFSARWLRALVWGLVYVLNVPVFFNTRVSLFQVASAQQSSVVTEAAEAFNRVGSAVGTAVMQRMPSDYARGRQTDVIV